MYLSPAEDQIFEAMLRRQSCSASELVRAWLVRAEAQYQRRNESTSPPVDPRQVSLEGVSL